VHVPTVITRVVESNAMHVLKVVKAASLSGRYDESGICTSKVY
jgi:hypothetical protein